MKRGNFQTTAICAKVVLLGGQIPFTGLNGELPQASTWNLQSPYATTDHGSMLSEL